MATTEYKRRLDEITPTLLLSTKRKDLSEEVLIGAMLREPFSLHNYIGRLSRVALGNASNDLGRCFLEILDQFGKYGNYSAASVFQRTGKDLGFLASESVDIDLEWAVDNWDIEYKRWAMAQAYSIGVSEYNDPVKTALDISLKVDEAINRLGAKGEAPKCNGYETFMEWGADKLEGKEVEHATKPFLPDMLEFVPSFGPGEFWIVAARPGMGKTQFAVNQLLEFHEAKAHGLFFSLEMSAERIFKRILSAKHGINSKSDWSGLDKKTIWDAISDTASIKDTCTIVDNAFHISEIEAQAIAASCKQEVKYIFVDYLQLTLAAGKHANRDSEVGSIADALMRLAKKLKAPVIALAQLSRANETRGGSKRPALSDLRESGRIEQSADGVIFLHRPEYYGISEDENGMSTKGAAEIIIAKNRDGDPGLVLAEWNGIRGFRTKQSAPHAPKAAPVDFTIPTSARPAADEDIPF